MLPAAGSIEDGAKVFRLVMVVVKIRLRIGTPGVLRRERESAQEGEIGRVSDLELSVRDPLAAQAGDFAVAGQLNGIAGHPMDPRIANLFRYDGQPAAERVH